jgi:hypothetical protein
LKTTENGGFNSTSCTEYSTACETIDYVIRELVNITDNSVVYIDSGSYDYTNSNLKTVTNNI